MNEQLDSEKVWILLAAVRFAIDNNPDIRRDRKLQNNACDLDDLLEQIYTQVASGRRHLFLVVK